MSQRASRDPLYSAQPSGRWRGSIVKADYFEKLIFPKYGTPDRQKYYAIESSKNTRTMYKRFGIPADPVATPFNWKRLPFHANDMLPCADRVAISYDLVCLEI